MPDFLNHSLTADPTGNKLIFKPVVSSVVQGLNTIITVRTNQIFDIPIITGAAKIVQSHDQSIVIADFTGANAIKLALRAAGLNMDQTEALANVIMPTIMRHLAGLE